MQLIGLSDNALKALAFEVTIKSPGLAKEVREAALKLSKEELLELIERSRPLGRNGQRFTTTLRHVLEDRYVGRLLWVRNEDLKRLDEHPTKNIAIGTAVRVLADQRYAPPSGRQRRYKRGMEGVVEASARGNAFASRQAKAELGTTAARQIQFPPTITETAPAAEAPPAESTQATCPVCFRAVDVLPDSGDIKVHPFPDGSMACSGSHKPSLQDSASGTNAYLKRLEGGPIARVLKDLDNWQARPQHSVPFFSSTGIDRVAYGSPGWEKAVDRKLAELEAELRGYYKPVIGASGRQGRAYWRSVPYIRAVARMREGGKFPAAGEAPDLQLADYAPTDFYGAADRKTEASKFIRQLQRLHRKEAHPGAGILLDMLTGPRPDRMVEVEWLLRRASQAPTPKKLTSSALPAGFDSFDDFGDDDVDPPKIPEVLSVFQKMERGDRFQVKSKTFIVSKTDGDTGAFAYMSGRKSQVYVGRTGETMRVTVWRTWNKDKELLSGHISELEAWSEMPHRYPAEWAARWKGTLPKGLPGESLRKDLIPGERPSTPFGRAMLESLEQTLHQLSGDTRHVWVPFLLQYGEDAKAITRRYEALVNDAGIKIRHPNQDEQGMWVVQQYKDGRWPMIDSQPIQAGGTFWGAPVGEVRYNPADDPDAKREPNEVLYFNSPKKAKDAGYALYQSQFPQRKDASARARSFMSQHPRAHLAVVRVKHSWGVTYDLYAVPDEGMPEHARPGG